MWLWNSNYGYRQNFGYHLPRSTRKRGKKAHKINVCIWSQDGHQVNSFILYTLEIIWYGLWNIIQAKIN